MKSKTTNRIFKTIVFAVVSLFKAGAAWGFSVVPLASSKHSLMQQRTLSHQTLYPRGSGVSHLNAFDDSSLVLATESWRQYVPLVVSVGIIIDILLGNPLANSFLKPLRREEESNQGENDESNNSAKPISKARIDAELIAQQALDKANNTLELKQFLEERKTDYDRMEEMKRKLDLSMQDLDEDLEARQRTIDERKTG